MRSLISSRTRVVPKASIWADHIQNEVRIGLIGHLDGAIAAGTRIYPGAAQNQHGERLAPTQQSSAVGQDLHCDLPAVSQIRKTFWAVGMRW